MSETPSVKKKGLQPKDLINIGIFTALYFIIIMAVAMLGYVPIFIPLLSVICPLIGGIPYMLYITKVRHFGMVFIMGIILGLLMGLGGMGVYAFITGPVCGLLADLVLRSGNYNSAGRAIISHGVNRQLYSHRHESRELLRRYRLWLRTGICQRPLQLHS